MFSVHRWCKNIGERSDALLIDAMRFVMTLRMNTRENNPIAVDVFSEKVRREVVSISHFP